MVKWGEVKYSNGYVGFGEVWIFSSFLLTNTSFLCILHKKVMSKQQNKEI
jgi:hypothetical protein